MQNVSICFQADDFNDFFTVEQGDRIKDVRTQTRTLIKSPQAINS